MIPNRSIVFSLIIVKSSGPISGIIANSFTIATNSDGNSPFTAGSRKETPLDHQNGPMPEDYFDYYDMPNKKMNIYRGWEIYEKGIYDILTNTRENYGNIKCYISENGMGVEGEERFVNSEGVIEDDYRITFVTDHLKYVHQAIQEGTNCVGYHMWTCMDNWSWTNAYKNRYGLIAVDLNQDGKRTIKKSGHWFKTVAMKNGFEA